MWTSDQAESGGMILTHRLVLPHRETRESPPQHRLIRKVNCVSTEDGSADPFLPWDHDAVPCSQFYCYPRELSEEVVFAKRMCDGG